MQATRPREGRSEEPLGADWRARIRHSALFLLVRGARNELSPIVPLGAAMTVRNVGVLPRVRRETAQRRIGATRPTSMLDARYPIASASRRSTCGLLQVGGEEPPALGQTLEVVLPTIGKPDLRTRNEVGNGSRHQHLIGPCGRCHPCRDVHGDAAYIVSA